MSTKTLTRYEKSRLYGIDVGDNLDWSGWLPGGEYIKTINIKNVCNDVRIIKYKLPATKFFYMKFPKIIKLAPGNSITLDISFRPIKAEEYNDHVEFITDLGTFQLPIKASLLSRSLKIPEFYDFGICAINEINIQSFNIINDGHLPISYEWNDENPFNIEPKKGNLNPGQEQKVTIKFYPTDASVYVASIYCNVADLGPKNMKVSGISKYPYFTASDNMVQFGDVLTGTVAETEFLLQNVSAVKASFKLVPIKTPNHTEVFTLSTGNVNSLDAGKSVSVKVTYKPKSTGTYSSDFFDFVTPGGNTTRVQCCGSAIGPTLTISQDTVFFGDVEIGSKAKKVIQINNHSDIPVNFEFTGAGDTSITNDASFLIDTMRGVIPAKLHISIGITFQPLVAINFYKRIFCQIKDADTLFLDLIGTSFDDEHRPAPMQIKDITNYELRKAAGLQRIPPDCLLPKTLDLKLNPKELGFEFEGVIDNLKHIVAPPRPDGNVLYFLDNCDPNSEVLCESRVVSFGAGACLRKNDYKNIIVANKTPAKMTCVWDIPAKGNGVFVVHPVEQDIPPFSSVTFLCSFRPTVENLYYSQQLEAFCYYKNQRTFRLVKEDLLVPPTCVRALCLGHTFSHEQFVPNAKLSSTSIAFPGCLVGHTVYQTIALSNNADTPLMFNFKDSSLLRGTFDISPSSGVITAHSFQLLNLSFSPSSNVFSQDAFSCLVNSSMVLRLPVQGTGWLPSVQFDTKELYFFPTCIGCATRQEVTIKNRSRIDTIFRWNLKPEDQEVITILPVAGMLRGNESLSFMVQFLPNKSQNYKIKVPFVYTFFSPSMTALSEIPPSQCFTNTLTLNGSCTTGVVAFNPPSFDFGAILLGTNARTRISLENLSTTLLKYNLIVVRNDEFNSDEEGESFSLANKNDGGEFIITPSEGELSAKCKIEILIDFMPTLAKDFTYRLVCLLEGENVPKQADFCLLKASAKLPVLQITDLRMDNNSETRGWEILSADLLNQQLISPLNNFENLLLVRLTSEKALSLNDYREGLNNISFKFEAGLQGNQPEIVFLQFRNTGDLVVDWSCKFPKDLEIEAERWADKGELSNEDVLTADIEEKRVFTVEPRSGILQPGETCSVRFTYSHKTLGNHELHALLSVAQGKQVVLNLIGQTIDMNSQVVSLPCETSLVAMPIGLKTEEVPEQYYKLVNNSTWDLQYTIDASEIDRLREENYGIDIFWLPQKSGTISAMSTNYIPIYFRPLECKLYSLDLVILYSNSQTEPLKLNINSIGFSSSASNKITSSDVIGTQMFPSSFPKTPSLVIPGQLAQLSHLVMDFGVLPLHSVQKRVVTMHNIKDFPLSYQWDVLADFISIEPSSGEILPNQTINFLISFSSSILPTVIDRNITCMLAPIMADVKATWKANKGTIALNPNMLNTMADATSRTMTSRIRASTSYNDSLFVDFTKSRLIQTSKKMENYNIDFDKIFDIRTSGVVNLRIIALVHSSLIMFNEHEIRSKVFTIPPVLKPSEPIDPEFQDVPLLASILDQLIKDTLDDLNTIQLTSDDKYFIDLSNENIILPDKEEINDNFISDEFKILCENVVDSAIYSVIQELNK